jgi:hypothetical protein
VSELYELYVCVRVCVCVCLGGGGMRGLTFFWWEEAGTCTIPVLRIISDMV